MKEDEEWTKKWEDYGVERPESADGHEGNREPNSIGDFLKDNSELFTIIGVFAAVAFYFVQFEEVPLEQIEIGLVSSLIIFLIVSLVAIKTTLDEVSYALNAESAFHATTYIIIALCFFGLVISIYNALQSYAPSIDPTLTFFASIAVVVFYIVGIFSDDRITEVEGWQGFEIMVDYAPHIAIGLVVMVLYSASRFGELSVGAADENILAITIGIVYFHLFMMVFVVGLAVVGEKCQSFIIWVQNKYEEYFAI